MADAKVELELSRSKAKDLAAAPEIITLLAFPGREKALGRATGVTSR